MTLPLVMIHGMMLTLAMGIGCGLYATMLSTVLPLLVVCIGIRQGLYHDVYIFTRKVLYVSLFAFAICMTFRTLTVIQAVTCLWPVTICIMFLTTNIFKGEEDAG